MKRLTRKRIDKMHDKAYRKWYDLVTGPNYTYGRSEFLNGYMAALEELGADS